MTIFASIDSVVHAEETDVRPAEESDGAGDRRPESGESDGRPESEESGQRPPGPDERKLTADEVYDLAANQRRRWIVRFLEETPETTLPELTDHIATIENGGAYTSSQRKSVYVSLYQVHLPKLEDACVVEFDPDRKTIAVGRNHAQVRRVTRLEEEPIEAGWMERLSDLLPGPLGR